jgi:hypothetical protein
MGTARTAAISITKVERAVVFMFARVVLVELV